MADAKKCDRCGSFYTKISDSYFVVGKDIRSLNASTGFFSTSTKVLDLCPECSTSLVHWMKEPTEEVDRDCEEPVEEDKE